jgi:chitodextrinase
MMRHNHYLKVHVRVAAAGFFALAMLVAATASLPIALATSGSLYVNNTAANCTDGGSGTSTQPYCTITKAAQVATAGTTVYVTGGTYTGTAINPTSSGLSGSPITFTASAGVTISGGTDAFAISSRSYIVIDSFTVTSTTAVGISVSSSNHITISNNTVTGSGQRVQGLTAPGISLSGTASSLITHNQSDNNSDHGFLISAGSANNTVSFNEASFNAEGWQRNANGINVTDTGSTGNVLLGNIVHDNEDSGLQFYPGANNGVAANNVTYNNGDHGIDDLNVTGGDLIGNTVYHNCTSGINVEGTSGYYTVMNNISVDNAVYPAYKGISCYRRTGDIGIYDSAPATTTMDYNFVYLTTSGDLYVWNNTSYSSPTALYNATGQEQHGIQADPKWISWTTPNFRLQEGSLAIDSANSGAPGESTVDADNNPRVDDPLTPNTGVGPRTYDDRGAYEFQPSVTDTQPPTVPTGLTASATAPTSVSLSWNASTDNVGVAGYTVYRNGTSVATVSAPTLTYTDTSVAASTTYSYTVDAFDTSGNHSAQSAPASVTTPAPDTQPPTVPTGLASTGVTSTTVGLAWNASTDNVGVTGYTVYRNGSPVGTPATTAFTDSGLTQATSYTYTVDAFDAAGNHSAQSAAITATTAAKPVAFVQAASKTTGTRHTSMTLALTKPVAAGDLLTGLFAQLDAAGQVQVSDNVNGSWIRANGMTYTTGKGDIALFYLPNSKAAATGLTITITATASTLLYGAVSEYSGIAGTAPLDQATIKSGSGTSVDSGPTASVAAGELVFGSLTSNNSLGPITAGTSQGLTFTMRSSSSNIGGADILTGASGPQDARFSITKSLTWYAAVAVFKPALAAPDTTPPTVPTGLTGTSATGSVNLSWNASTDNVGVTGYTVYRNGTILATVGGTTLAYTDTSVASATTYTYTVDAFDAAGNHSAQSSPVSITAPDWTPPSTPTGLSANNGAGTVVLSWNASTDNVGVTGYTVYRNGTTLATVAGSVLSYTDATVSPATIYSYTVDAFDAAGNHSAQSQPASVTTPAQTDTTPPSTPTGLNVTAGPAGEVDLAWSASTDDVGVTGYTVYRNGTSIGTVNGSTLSYADKTVASVTTYTYTVDAYDAAGNHSPQSSPASITTADWTPPSVPTGLSAVAASSSEIDLSWQASTDDVSVAGYNVYRNGSLDATVGSGTLTYADTGLSDGVRYSYTVAAFDPAGNASAQSGPASATTPDVTPPTMPGGLTVTATSSTSVAIGWSASTDNVGVAGYDVYRDGAVLVTVGSSVLSYTDTVAMGSTHSYTVDAFDAAGNHSVTPAPITVTTPSTDTTPPTTPTGLTAIAPSFAQVNLSWNASTDNVGVAGYTVYRNGAVLTTVAGGLLSYTDSTVVPATNYTYAVDAFDAAGNHSALSSTVSVHVPGQVKFVQGKAVTSGARVTSLAISFGPVAQGDLLVGWFGEYDSSGQVKVTDSVNGAWTRSAASTTWSGSTGDIALYYFANSAAASSGLTITVSATNATYLQGGPAEYSGVATTNPLDQVVIAKGSGTSADSGLTAATGWGELVYGGMVATNGGGTLVPGASQGVSFVKRAQSTSGSQGLEDIVSSAAGQQHAGFTFTNSVAWFMVCAVFKPA